MIKNIVFDIGNVLAKEVNGRALTHLSAVEQNRISDLIYYKSSDFVEVLLGRKTTAEYSAELAAAFPQLINEINFLFDPKNLPITYPIQQQVLDLLYELHETYKIYFLSDTVDISFEYVKKILEDFDGGAYSFQEHLKKPNPAFFQVLLERYHLNPAETIFFDDKEKNVAVARSLGMQAAVFVDVDSVRQALKNG